MRNIEIRESAGARIAKEEKTGNRIFELVTHIAGRICIQPLAESVGTLYLESVAEPLGQFGLQRVVN